MNRIEDSFLRGVLAKEPSLTEAEQKLFDLFERKNVKSRVERSSQQTLLEFAKAKVYDLEEVKANIQQVKRKKAENGDKTERGILLEEMFEAYLSDFLFDDMVITKTEDYDDRFNKIDFVLEGETKDGQNVYLGIDVTSSNDDTQVQRKLNDIAEDLRIGKLGRVKYFKSAETLELRNLEFIPRVVISFNSEKIGYLAEAILATVGKNIKVESVLKECDFLKKDVYDEIIKQLEVQVNSIDKDRDKFKREGQTNLRQRMRNAVLLALEKIKQFQAEKNSAL